MDAKTLSHLLQLIHQTPTRPERWVAALDTVKRVVGASFSAVVARERATGNILAAPTCSDAPDQIMVEYREHYAEIDVVAAALQQFGEGEVITDSRILQNDALRSSEVFNDFYLRRGLRHHLGGFAVNDADVTASLVVYRECGPFGSDEVETMRMILPHVNTALHTWMRLNRPHPAVTIEDLEWLRRGVILLDERGRLAWMNRAARGMLSVDAPLVIAGRELRGRDSDVTAALSRSIAAALTHNLEATPCRVALQDVRGDTFALLIAPFDGSYEASPYRVIVFVDSERRVRPSLRTRFGLSVAEEALALALAEGKSLSDFAELRRVAIGTARAQLKRVFIKTGARRQSDVVRLVLEQSQRPSFSEA